MNHANAATPTRKIVSPTTRSHRRMWVYTHVEMKGSSARQRLFLGFLAWIMGQVPLWLIWYAEQPWPGSR
jgi:hypothetical protein